MHRAKADLGRGVIIAMTKRLEKRGLTPKAIVDASMRKLVHMIYGVIKSGR